MKRILLFAVLLFLLISSVSAELLYSQQNTNAGISVGDVSSQTSYLSFNVTPVTYWNITAIEVNITYLGTPQNDPVTMVLRTADPTDQYKAKSVNICTATNTYPDDGSQGFFNFTFLPSCNISEHKSLAIVLSRPVHGAGFPYIRYYDTGTFTIGRKDVEDYTGSAWNILDSSAIPQIRIYGTQPVTSTFQYTNRTPENNTQINMSEIDLNITVKGPQKFNVTLIYNTTKADGTSTVTTTSLGQLNPNLWIKRNWNIVYADSRQIVWHYNFSYDGYSELTPEWIVYGDITKPTLTTSFVNKSLYHGNNITALFNFTDEFSIFSFNASVDGEQINYTDNILSNESSFNLNIDSDNYNTGAHTLRIDLSDGHTAKEIPDFNYKDGLFNDYLEYTTQTSNIKINQKDKSIFDSWETTKKKDRYVFDFEPSDKTKTSYTFEVEADQYINIIETDSKYKNYLIIGNNWVDFVLEDQPQTKVDIKRISETLVEVTVKDLTKADKLSFSSIGELNTITKFYTFFKVNITTSVQNPVSEGSSHQSFILFNYSDAPITDANISAQLYYNNTNRTYSIRTDTNTFLEYSYNLFAPEVDAQTVVYFNWTYNITNQVDTLLRNHTVIPISIDNCSTYTGNFINFSLLDETTKDGSALTNGTIETYIVLYTNVTQWELNTSTVGDGAIVQSLCLNSGAYNETDFRANATVRYFADDHSVEFYYFQNYPIENATFQDIKLYTLNTDTALSEYSTSFLINYQNTNFLNVPDAIMDLHRHYVKEGRYISVEHAKTDDSGNTRLHLVTEDLEYKVVVRKDNEILYTSNPFLAICQDTPCQINFQEKDQLNNVWDYLDAGNLNYNMDLDKAARKATVSFATKDGSTSTVNLRVTKNDGYFNQTVCNKNVTSSGGSIFCEVPITARNSTYIVELYTFNSPEHFEGFWTFVLNNDPRDVFGPTAIIMTFLLFLTLVAMAIQSGVEAVVAFGAIGLVIATLMLIFNGGSIFGIGSTIMWVIVAAVIIIWKSSKK